MEARLNGPYIFFFSETQKKENEGKKYYDPRLKIKRPIRPTFVKICGEWKEYTECAHLRHIQRDDYIPHDKRYDDSVCLGPVVDPEYRIGEPDT